MEKNTLISTLKNDDKWEARRDAAEELGNFKDKDVIEALIVALDQDDNSIVRFMSANSLGEIGSVDAVFPLIKALEDSEETVIEYAAKALGKIGDERAIEPLTIVLSKATHPEFVDSIIGALSKLGVDPKKLDDSQEVAYQEANIDKHPASEQTQLPLIWRVVAIAIALFVIVALVIPLLNNRGNNTGPAPQAVQGLGQEAAAGEVAMSAEELFKQGQEYYQANNWAAAITAYQQAIERDPEYLAAYVNLGDTYYQNQQLDLAIETYEQVLTLEPDDAEVIYNLGAALFQQAMASGQVDQAKLDEAITRIERAIELNPDLPQPYYALGAAYQILGDDDQAIESFEKFLELDDGSDTLATNNAQQILQALQASPNE